MNATVRSYVSAFRIKELQQVLQQLGLAKHGNKPELQARLFAYFGEPNGATARGVRAPREQWKLESAARIITVTYCRLKNLPLPAGTPNAAPASTAAVQPNSMHRPAGPMVTTTNAVPNGVPRPPLPAVPAPEPALTTLSQAAAASNTQVRCVCGSNYDHGRMVQCEGSGCGVWQHCSCVGLSSEQEAGAFFCEACRVALADPFWEVGEQVVGAARLRPHLVRSAMGLPLQAGQAQEASRAFQRSAAHDAQRRDPAHQLQVVSLLLGDPVPFRFHWPRHADLRINSMQYRPYSRNPATLLATTGRDEPAAIDAMSFAGRNRVSLSCVDARPFLFLAHTARRRSTEEVKALMPAAETLEAALARVRRKVNAAPPGAGAGGGADDSDDELLTLSTVLSLRCPLSGARIDTPARFTNVAGLVAFDLDTFLAVTQRSRRWCCPNSMAQSTVRQLQVDAYITAVLACLTELPDVMEVEIDAEGRWRPASSSGPFRSVLDPPVTPEVKAEAASVKQEDAADAVRLLLTVAGAAAAESSGEESESEGEEMRKAAQAYAAAARKPVAPKPEVIVLSDSDDDEDDVPVITGATGPARPRPPPAASRQLPASFSQRPPPPPPSDTLTTQRWHQMANGTATQPPGPQAGGRQRPPPLTIRLPNRAAPASQRQLQQAQQRGNLIQHIQQRRAAGSPASSPQSQTSQQLSQQQQPQPAVLALSYSNGTNMFTAAGPVRAPAPTAAGPASTSRPAGLAPYQLTSPPSSSAAHQRAVLPFIAQPPPQQRPAPPLTMYPGMPPVPSAPHPVAAHSLASSPRAAYAAAAGSAAALQQQQQQPALMPSWSHMLPSVSASPFGAGAVTPQMVFQSAPPYPASFLMPAPAASSMPTWVDASGQLQLHPQSQAQAQPVQLQPQPGTSVPLANGYHGGQQASAAQGAADWSFDGLLPDDYGSLAEVILQEPEVQGSSPAALAEQLASTQQQQAQAPAINQPSVPRVSV